jgi:CO dehydrogenase/acetyl-CoA synthase epsilon subunit
MNKLKIPENHSGISKALRLPENIVDDIQNLANLKNLSFNRTIITLLEFSLDNLEEDDRLYLDQMSK